jgi:hypothetical protein
MLPISQILRLVSCVVDRLPLALSPAPLAWEPKREQAASIIDATTCLPQVVKDRRSLAVTFRLPFVTPSCHFRQPGRSIRSSFSGERLRPVSLLSFVASPLQVSLCVTQARRMLVASRVPVNPARDFFLLVSLVYSSAKLRGSLSGHALLVLVIPFGLRTFHTSVEKRGLEPLTSCLQSRRSTS